ncbi:MAG: hypothetical protein R2715_22385 [Ilumatobacteraceae bacterium]
MPGSSAVARIASERGDAEGTGGVGLGVEAPSVKRSDRRGDQAHHIDDAGRVAGSS